MLSLYGEAGQTSLTLDEADRQIRTLDELGKLYTTVGNTDAAGRAFAALVANLEQRSRQETDPSVKRDLAISHIKLGNIRMAQGDLPAALENYRGGQSHAAGPDRGAARTRLPGSAIWPWPTTRSAMCW